MARIPVSAQWVDNLLLISSVAMLTSVQPKAVPDVARPRGALGASARELWLVARGGRPDPVALRQTHRLPVGLPRVPPAFWEHQGGATRVISALSLVPGPVDEPRRSQHGRGGGHLPAQSLASATRLPSAHSMAATMLLATWKRGGGGETGLQEQDGVTGVV